MHEPMVVLRPALRLAAQNDFTINGKLYSQSTMNSKQGLHMWHIGVDKLCFPFSVSPQIAESYRGSNL